MGLVWSGLYGETIDFVYGEYQHGFKKGAKLGQKGRAFLARTYKQRHFRYVVFSGFAVFFCGRGLRKYSLLLRLLGVLQYVLESDVLIFSKFRGVPWGTLCF